MNSYEERMDQLEMSNATVKYIHTRISEKARQYGEDEELIAMLRLFGNITAAQLNNNNMLSHYSKPEAVLTPQEQLMAEGIEKAGTPINNQIIEFRNTKANRDYGTSR